MGAVAPEDAGRTVANAFNWLDQAARVLQRIGGLLAPLGEMAPPCAAVPYMEARNEIAGLSRFWRTQAISEFAPESRAAVVAALDRIDAEIAKAPVLDRMWTDAPAAWQVRVVSAPTGVLGWQVPWHQASDLAVTAVEGVLVTAAIAADAPAVAVALVVVAVGGEAVRAFFEAPRGVGAITASGAAMTGLAAVKFYGQTLPRMYQQVLGVWVLSRSTQDKELFRRAMQNMDPSTLPTMPAGWDGTFAHIREPQEGGHGTALLALLAGAVGALALAVAFGDGD